MGATPMGHGLGGSLTDSSLDGPCDSDGSRDGHLRRLRNHHLPARGASIGVTTTGTRAGTGRLVACGCTGTAWTGTPCMGTATAVGVDETTAIGAACIGAGMPWPV